jgi:predicted RNase H-like HicB family nuclease
MAIATGGSGMLPPMKVVVVVHPDEDGGFWAEVPSIPGCATEGDTMDELFANLKEAIEGCLDSVPDGIELVGDAHLLKIAV